MRHLLRNACLCGHAVLALASGGCAGDRVTGTVPEGGARWEVDDPMPASAVAVNLGALGRATWVNVHSTYASTDPLVIFQGLVPHDPRGFPTPDGLWYATVDRWFDPATGITRWVSMEFSAPVSRVRVFVSYLSNPFTLRCVSADLREVTGSLPDRGDAFSRSPWLPVDVSLPGIRSCTFEGYAMSIHSLSFVPEDGRRSGLRLTCANGLAESETTSAERASLTVERGKRISCKAVALASGTVEVVGWRFRGGEFVYPDVAAGDPEVTGPEWGGEIATSGVVSVRAKVDGGAEVTREIAVEAAPRADFRRRRVPITVRRGVLADLPPEARPPPMPRRDEDLGAVFIAPSVPGWPISQDADVVGRYLRIIVDGGPNDGLAYLVDVPLTVSAIVVVHPELSEGSAFQAAQAADTRVVSGTPPCLRHHFDTYIRLVEAHEGVDGNPHSHVGYYDGAINPAAAEAVEDLVGESRKPGSLAAMAKRWDDRVRPAVREAIRRTEQDLDRDHPVPFGCNFNWNVRPRRS